MLKDKSSCSVDVRSNRFRREISDAAGEVRHLRPRFLTDTPGVAPRGGEIFRTRPRMWGRALTIGSTICQGRSPCAEGARRHREPYSGTRPPPASTRARANTNTGMTRNCGARGVVCVVWTLHRGRGRNLRKISESMLQGIVSGVRDNGCWRSCSVVLWSMLVANDVSSCGGGNCEDVWCVWVVRVY